MWFIRYLNMCIYPDLTKSKYFGEYGVILTVSK